MQKTEREDEARALTLTLLDARADGSTVCPSEIARALMATEGLGAPPSDWRGAMPIVHAAVEGLLADHLVQLTWKGRALTRRVGPYRIGRDRNPAT